MSSILIVVIIFYHDFLLLNNCVHILIISIDYRKTHDVQTIRGHIAIILVNESLCKV